MKFEIGNKVWAYSTITDKKVFGIVKETYKLKYGTCVTIETDSGKLEDFWGYQLNREN